MKWAEVSNIEAASEKWPDAYVKCRSYGHVWKSMTVTSHGTGFTVYQVCDRCFNQRSQDMDSRGYATQWHMTYNPDYLLKDLGRVDGDGRAVLRLAAIRHMNITEEKE